MYRLWAIGVVVTAAMLGLSATMLDGGDASANHIAGATYTGNHTGGGTVEFTITPDGSGIMSFAATSVPGNTCEFDEISVNFSQPLPINNHMFERVTGIGLSFAGSFPSSGAAEGTLRAVQQAIPPFVPGCDSGTITWDAETGSPGPTPTPSPTASPTGGPLELVQGDVDCDGDSDAVDALKTLQDIAAIPYEQEPDCPNVGGAAPAGEPPDIFGDADCDGDVDAVDALKILQFVAAISFEQSEPCTDIGVAF